MQRWFGHGRISRLDWSPMVKKLLHTRYRVTDLDKTVHFYKDVLGLDEVRRMTSGRGSQLVFFKAPGSEELIELCFFPSSGPVQVQPDLTHLAFEVECLEAELADLGPSWTAASCPAHADVDADAGKAGAKSA